MEYFWKHKEFVPTGVGYGQFTLQHLLLVCFSVLLTVWITRDYKKSNRDRRIMIRRIIAALLMVGEVLKLIVMYLGGVDVTEYLPLEICSFAAYSIVCDSIWPDNQVFPQMLITLFLPGAIMTHIVPTTTMLPLVNFFTLHQFIFHGLIVAYVVARFYAGEIKIDYSGVWKSILKILLIASFVFTIDMVFHRNFMFLMNPDGNPLLEVIQRLAGGPGIGYTLGLVLLATIVIHIFFVVFKLIEKLLPSSSDTRPIL